MPDITVLTVLEVGTVMVFFPAGSIGWNLAGEDFFKKQFPIFQLFKIRASYGLVGSDAVIDNRYLYQQVYARGSYYYFGTTANTVQGIYEGSLGNANVTWEKSKKKRYWFRHQYAEKIKSP